MNAPPCALAAPAGAYTGAVRAVVVPTIEERMLESTPLSAVALSAKNAFCMLLLPA